jgi:hypothetical protein
MEDRLSEPTDGVRAISFELLDPAAVGRLRS